MAQLLSAEDLFQLRAVSDPQVSPDGTRVAWVLTWIEPDCNQYRSQIYFTDLETFETSRFSPGPRDTHPRFSPDGQQLLFLGQTPLGDDDPGPEDVMGKGPQLFVASLASGDAQLLTRLRGGVTSPSWSPDGTRVSFCTYVHPDRGLETLGDERPEPTPYERYNADVLRVRRLQWKWDGVGHIGDCVRQVACLDHPMDPERRRVRLLSDAPSDLSAPCWSPDGQWVAAVGNLRPAGERERRRYIYLLDPEIEASLPKEAFGLEEMRGDAITWLPSSDGFLVAGHDDPWLGHYGNQRLWRVPFGSSTGECLTRDIDLTFGDYSRDGDIKDYPGQVGPLLTPDPEQVWVLVNHRESTNLFRFSLTERWLHPVTELEGAVTAFSADAKGQHLVALISDAQSPGDLYWIENAGRDASVMHRITDVNGDFLADRVLARPTAFEFASDGHMVRGWLTSPAESATDEKYPVLLYHGGGPGGMRTGIFSFTTQYLAARGYAVLHVNARGNQGRGEAFSAAIRGRWGDQDLQDNLRALDYVLREFDGLDAERLGVFGGSYGGYMTNWTLSHDPRFGAGVSINCLYNRLSDFGTGDMSALLEKVEFDGTLPWDEPEVFWDRSPMKFVEQIQAPTLVIHAGRDHRCPVDQGEQLYFALRYREVPTELIRIAEASHGIREPWHRVMRMQVTADWFDRWLKTTESD